MGVPSDPNWPKEGPRQGQGGTKGPQGGPKEAQRGSKMAPMEPQGAHNGSFGITFEGKLVKIR